MATSKQQWIADNLKAGEVYAGLILGQKGEPDYHLILLPGKIENADWATAADWAKKQGGELPTRREQSLLIANCKAEFEPRWYWSSEKLDASYACTQHFFYGGQYATHIHYQFRARAVRRLVLL
jgi:hypothetical protein